MSTRKQAEGALVIALAGGATVEAAARRCGFPVTVVRRKLADEKFRRRVQHARGDLTERACGLLTAAGLAAVRALAELQRASSPPAVRLAAAKAVIELGVKLRTVVDLESRVNELEALIDRQEAADTAAGRSRG